MKKNCDRKKRKNKIVREVYVRMQMFRHSHWPQLSFSQHFLFFQLVALQEIDLERT